MIWTKMTQNDLKQLTLTKNALNDLNEYDDINDQNLLKMM